MRLEVNVIRVRGCCVVVRKWWMEWYRICVMIGGSRGLNLEAARELLKERGTITVDLTSEQTMTQLRTCSCRNLLRLWQLLPITVKKTKLTDM
jgi:hypothetical protein